MCTSNYSHATQVVVFWIRQDGGQGGVKAYWGDSSSTYYSFLEAPPSAAAPKSPAAAAAVNDLSTMLTYRKVSLATLAATCAV